MQDKVIASRELLDPLKMLYSQQEQETRPSPLHKVLGGSTVQPSSYSMGIGAVCPGAKWPGRETDNPPPSSAEVQNAGAMPTLPHSSS
jgi:hypothetical protein